MKILPHDTRQVKYKILRLDSKKKFFLVSWVIAVEMVVFSDFRARKCLHPLGVKRERKKKKENN